MSVPEIYNLTIGAANEVHQFTFPGKVAGYQFQARTNVDLIFAWRPGRIEAGVYMTLKAGSVYAHDTSEGAAIIQPNATLFVACATAGTVVEIEVW